MEKDAGHRKLAVLPQTRPVRAAAARPVQSVAEFLRSPSLHLPWLPVAHPRLKKAHRAVCPMQGVQPAWAQRWKLAAPERDPQPALRYLDCYSREPAPWLDG
jgi:hypothetical protein